VGDFNTLFSAVDRKSKLYQRREDYLDQQHAVLARFLPPMPTVDAARPLKPLLPGKLPIRELTEQALLQHLAPVGVLVNAKGDILYLHGRTGQYLEPAQGEAGINNILMMAREGLKHELTTALHKAASGKDIIRCAGLRVKTNGEFTTVNLTIRAVQTGRAFAANERPLHVIILEPEHPVQPRHAMLPPLSDTGLEGQPIKDADSHIAALKQELRVKEEYLQTSNEELETSNEELKSANEEMQSVNEELQSTNEELETSKEELQSINEELATVNSELQTKVADLSRANNDMNNLLAGTGIGTVFVDHGLRILRFTPAANTFINLIQSDIGRPVGHIVSNLIGYNDLVVDTQTVLNTLIPKEVDVQTTEGMWYRMHIQPYRTLENMIEGAVITFFDITEKKRAWEMLGKANKLIREALIVRDARVAAIVQSLDGRILSWNSGAAGMYGWSESEALSMNIRDRVPFETREEISTILLRLSRGELQEPYPAKRITKAGTVLDVWLTVTLLMNEAGQMTAIATVERPMAPAETDQAPAGPT
jgi:two-component system CheB/CheR fusion protein